MQHPKSKTQRPTAVKSKLHKRPQEIARSGELNEQQVINAMQRHAQSPLALLNRGERKIVRQNMVDELSQGFEHRRQALGMALETRLHSIQEACNHVLVTGKTHLRQQRLEYFGQVFRQVESSMNALSDDFLKDMDARFERLDSFKSDAIKQREKQRLEKSVGDFLDTLDQLMDEFRSIISENITHGETSENGSQQTATDFEERFEEYEQDSLYPQEEEQVDHAVSDVAEEFMSPNLQHSNWMK